MCLPFFGCDLNLLPFLMSGVSLAALLRFRSAVLTPASFAGNAGTSRA